ncbi:MAG: methyltransferase domain-containing protein [Bacteroidetes bacterium]|nr:methyltransferase domain-containing protein [Bacteroidota bacterium]
MDSNEIYEDFYYRIESSKTFSKYCHDVFEIDLSQDGFSDISQLDSLIKYLQISESDNCLDIGCGNGNIDNYINKMTNSKITGIDFSKNAVDYAKNKFQLNESLSFHQGNINNLNLPKDRYSIIILVDSIYFSNDYSATLDYLFDILKENGNIGIFYSDFVFDPKKQTKKIEIADTEIANLIDKNKWKYIGIDFTEAHYMFMKKKYIISDKYKDDFVNENNEWLYSKIHIESISPDMEYEDFIKFTNRYLYIIQKSSEQQTLGTLCQQ